MNILFYYDKTISPRHGGIAQVTLTLGKELEKKSHNVFFLSAAKTKDDEVGNQHYLPISTKENQKSFFIDFLHNKKIDIIVNQNGITCYYNEAIIWGHETNIPVVTVLHNSLDGIYGINGRLHLLPRFLRTQKLISTINSMCHFYFKLKYGRYYKEQLKLSHKIVLLSDRFIPEYLYYSSSKFNDKIMSIPNPITIESNTSMENKKEKEILFVGRMVHEKRVDLLLKIWQKLHSKYPDWKLAIVGDGILKEKMEKLSQSLKLERVSFEGFQHPLEYYKKASIFCMTSAFEGFGLVLIEAMAYGTVPIAFNSYKNVSEIIDNNRNGFIIPPFQIEEYARKISLLIENPLLLNNFSIDAKLKSELYTAESITNKWINLFEEIKNNSQNRN